jgi:phosphoribosyl 1,2-cyclic phosphodiesterase
MRPFTVRFWGVRGSVANGGVEFAGIGGNTSCVEVRAGDELIILDSGTGVRALGQTLPRGARATFLFSHLHWDHIQGFPFFTPAYVPGNAFTLYGPGESRADLLAALSRQMQPPNFPVTLEAMGADLDFRNVRAGDALDLGPARVQVAALNHPQGCLGYRISVGGSSVVYATDTEHPAPGVIAPALLDLSRGADLLICDSQYTDDEYEGRSGPPKKGWGHSTIREACRLAEAAGVKRLRMIPSRSKSVTLVTVEPSFTVGSWVPVSFLKVPPRFTVWGPLPSG